MKKRIMLFFMLVFFSIASVYAEYDDDITISVGNFELRLGWGLSYYPESIDKNETILPLLLCVEKYYNQLKQINRSFNVELSSSKTAPGSCELIVWERDIDNYRSYNCKTEEECVSVLVNLVSKLIPVAKPGENNDELTMYLVIKKRKFENEQDWRAEGEFRRHGMSYNITADNYFYALYFSLEEAGKMVQKNPDSKVQKIICTKENINYLNIDWNTVIGY